MTKEKPPIGGEPGPGINIRPKLNARANGKKENLNPIIKLMREEGVEFLINVHNDPIVYIPEDLDHQYWMVDDRRVRMYLCGVYFHVMGDCIKDAQINQLVNLIGNECYRGGRRLTEADVEKFEQDPVFLCVVRLLSKEEGYDGKTEILLEKLHNVAPEVGVLSNELPAWTSTLTRKLRALKSPLEAAGVRVKTDHKEDGSYTDLHRLTSFVPISDGIGLLSSELSSGGSGTKLKRLEKPDDADGVEIKEGLNVPAKSAIKEAKSQTKEGKV